MSVSVTFNGSIYVIPTNNNIGWGTNLTNYLVAIAAGCLQKTGGSFLLSAETDFGAAFGLKSLYYKSRSSNVASAGPIRLANSVDGVYWRNSTNNGDHILTVDGSDALTFDGVPVAVGGSGTVSPGITNTLAYYPASTNIVNDLPAITASKALVSDINGLPVASITTTTELGYVSGVTSAIQTQINLKSPSSNPTFTGQVLIADGTAGTPSLAFSSNTDAGIYLAAANTIAFASSSTQTLRMTSSAVTLRGSGVDAFEVSVTGLRSMNSIPLKMHDGTVSNPSYTFDSDSDDGLYKPGVDQIALSLSGIQRVLFTGNQTEFPDGSLSLPSISYISDPDSGLTRLGANNIALSCGTTKTIDAKPTGVAILGTTTNDDAPTGFVGEYISSTTNNVSSPGSGQAFDITSISLTSGDWDISCNITFSNAGTTWSQIEGGISTTSGNSFSGLIDGNNAAVIVWASSSTTPLSHQITVPVYRVSINSTTTYYLKGAILFSGGTAKIVGSRISARRVR